MSVEHTHGQERGDGRQVGRVASPPPGPPPADAPRSVAPPFLIVLPPAPLDEVRHEWVAAAR